MTFSKKESFRLSRCSLDIGGTLAKIVTRDDPKDDTVEIPSFLGRETSLDFQTFKFGYFKSRETDELIQWLRDSNVVGSTLPISGGGSYKFQERFQLSLKTLVLKQDEMVAAMTGLSYLLAAPIEEVFRYDMASRTLKTVSLGSQIYPFLLINIGSGVSILKATAPRSFTRVTGTCVGGGTVLGLARLLLGVSTFAEVMELSRRGTDALDLKFEDLYGDAASSRFFSPSTLASSLGRLYIPPRGRRACEPLHTIRREDIARCLVTMVAYNLGYLAYLLGTIHGVNRFFFAGKFINNHKITMEAITAGVDFYSVHYDPADLIPRRLSETREYGLASSTINLSKIPSCRARSLSPVQNSQGPSVNHSSSHIEEPVHCLDRPKFEVLFLKHDGYLGALGAMLMSGEFAQEESYKP